MTDHKVLVVVRGARHSVDPTYACMAHDTYRGRYLMLEIENGRVSKRTTADDRRVVEERMRSGEYRGVYTDRRADSHLMPLTHPEQSLEADLASFRRAKSDEELEALASLSTATMRNLRADDNTTSKSFRGAAQTEGFKSAFQVTRAKGFVQYRGGLQDTLGRCSDLTRVDARTPEWEARLARAYRGLDAVRERLQVGTSVKELNDVFLSHMDAEKDYVYGDVVHHTGFESHETSVPLDRLEPYDFVTVGAAVGDGAETAVLYRAAQGVVPAAPPPSPPPSDDAPSAPATVADPTALTASFDRFAGGEASMSDVAQAFRDVHADTAEAADQNRHMALAMLAKKYADTRDERLFQGLRSLTQTMSDEFARTVAQRVIDTAAAPPREMATRGGLPTGRVLDDDE